MRSEPLAGQIRRCDTRCQLPRGHESVPACRLRDQRTGELSRQWVRLPLSGEEPSLQDIRECALEDLPDLGNFLPLWFSQLSNADRSNSVVRTLLLEAATMSGDLDGLGDLAHQPCPGPGSLFLEWLQALCSAGDDSKATEATREALSTLRIGSPNRAAIAEELAELSEPDTVAVLEARRLAWRSRPCETQLLVLHHAAAQLGDPARSWSTSWNTPRSTRNPENWADRCSASCLLFSGELERATRLLSLPSAQRENEVSGLVLVPYLPVSASNALGGDQHAIDWANSYLNTISRRIMLFGRPETPGKE